MQTKRQGWHVSNGMLEHPDGYEIAISSLLSAGAMLEWIYRLRHKPKLMIQFIDTLVKEDTR